MQMIPLNFIYTTVIILIYSNVKYKLADQQAHNMLQCDMLLASSIMTCSKQRPQVVGLYFDCIIADNDEVMKDRKISSVFIVITLRNQYSRISITEFVEKGIILRCLSTGDRRAEHAVTRTTRGGAAIAACTFCPIKSRELGILSFYHP